MKNPDATVERLARLTEIDRRWVLERLSSEARQKLVSHLGAVPAEAPAPEPVTVPPTPIEKYRAQLTGAEAGRVAEILRTEPPWLIQALLQIADWPWRNAFLQLLPGAVRVEVSRPGESKATLGPPAIEFLLCTLVERLAANGRDSSRKSQFELLVTRMGRKARPG